MAKEGLLFRIKSPKGPLYSQPNFIMGVYEFHVDRIDRDIAEKIDDVYDELIGQYWQNKNTKQLRVIPVNKSLERKDHVLQYNRIIDLVKADNEKPYAVAPCICRLEQEKKGTPTGRPLETCIMFGVVARYYIDNGIGRELTEQELLDKLNECEKEALIPLSTNSKKILNLCMCDKDGCQIIRNIRKFNKPAHQFHSGYVAKKDQETCTGCGKCEQRCQMQAISLTGYKKNHKNKPVFSINEDYCIGCGLCITKCPSNSIQMVEKDKEEIPVSNLDMNISMARERGQKMGLLPYPVVKWLLKLKLGKDVAKDIV